MATIGRGGNERYRYTTSLIGSARRQPRAAGGYSGLWLWYHHIMVAIRTPLELSTAADVAGWLGDGAKATDSVIVDSLAAAREICTEMIDLRRFGDDTDADDLPEALHRWVTMAAAQLVVRRRSIFGVEATSIGGEQGEVMAPINHDPTMRRLIAPYLFHGVAGWTPNRQTSPPALQHDELLIG